MGKLSPFNSWLFIWVFIMLYIICVFMYFFVFSIYFKSIHLNHQQTMADNGPDAASLGSFNIFSYTFTILKASYNKMHFGTHNSYCFSLQAKDRPCAE